MTTRLAGLGLILCGLLAALLFVWLPLRDGPDGLMGPVRAKVLVFIPLAIVIGLAFLVGGPPVLAAFQARPRSREQLALVLGLIIASGVLTALGYWQLKTRGPGAAAPAILDPAPHRPPPLPGARP